MRPRAAFLSMTIGLVVTIAATSSLPAAASAPRAAAAGRAAYEKSIDDALSSIQAYWKREYPALYGEKYIPLERVIAAAPGVAIPRCQGAKLSYKDTAGNAFYCFQDNFIVFDDARLFPQLAKGFGAFSIALVLAHEWGHAIQDRAGNAEQPTIGKELQADCFAGAWTSDQSSRSQGPDLQPGDLESSLAALLEFRDAPGTSPDDPAAHGSAFDRVNAFQEGFEAGPRRCAAYFDDPPVVVELPFSSAQDEGRGGDVPAADVIPLTVDLLNDFYGQVEPGYTPLPIDSVGKFDSSDRSSIPQCGGSKLTVKQVRNRVFYCIDDDYVAFDEPFLQKVYDEIGDFGVASLIANPFATRVQEMEGEPGVADNDLAIVFQADCYSGGFTAAFFNGYLQGSLSPGDLDELIEAFLVYSRARGVSADVPITFLRMGYFRRGFFDGYDACDLPTIQQEVANL